MNRSICASGSGYAKKVTIYTTQHCPHCVRAKALLESKKIAFKNVDLTDDDAQREKLTEQTGWMTVPIIFIGDEFIGGANELYALDSSGQLTSKLKS